MWKRLGSATLEEAFGACSLQSLVSQPLLTLSVAAVASTKKKAVSLAYSVLLVQSLLSCAFLRCPRAALAGPPILVSCILCLCLPLASVLLRCRVCLCLACILSLCLCLAPVLNPTTARMSLSCVWHRLVRPCLWCTCERACVTILFSPSQAPEVGYPQRPQLKQKQQAARTSTAQPRIKLNVSAMTWPTAGNVIAPAIRPSTSVMDILPDRPQLT